MHVHMIGDAASVLGFRLAGVEGTVASDRTTALEALKSVLARENLGIVLVTEGVAAEIRDSLEPRVYGMGFPLVLEIPGVSGPHPGRICIEDVVRKAIGVSI